MATPSASTTTTASSSAAASASTPTSIGWDAALTKPKPPSALDVNDYSRFKDIGIEEPDSEEEREQEKKRRAAAIASTASSCRNCGKTGAKLKCSICKKASYCARTCQAHDWVFHKRICKKPTPKDTTKDTKPSTPPAKSTSTSTSTSTSSTNTTTKRSCSSSPLHSPVKSTTSASSSNSSSPNKTVVLDEPELKDVRGYKNGLPYFHRELSPEEHEMIGDIAPKKIDQVDGANSNGTAPVLVTSQATVEHEGSAWNAAGTFEERDYSKWAEQKLKEFFNDVTLTHDSSEIVFKKLETLDGDASICVVRGRKRFLFDYNFKLPFEVTLKNTGTDKYKGSFHMQEISNEAQYEISFRWDKKPRDASVLSSLQSFLNQQVHQHLVDILARFVNEFQAQ